MEERQPVLLEGDETTIIGQAADAINVLNFTAGDFRLEAGKLADQVGKFTGAIFSTASWFKLLMA